jgi:hypothetical protein
VISAFAAGFDIAALVLFAAAATALVLYDRTVGTGFRLAAARLRMVLLGAAVFAAVNTAAVVEMVLGLRAGAETVAAPASVTVHGAVGAVLIAALAWRHARRGAERDLDAQLVRLTRGR